MKTRNLNKKRKVTSQQPKPFFSKSKNVQSKDEGAFFSNRHSIGDSHDPAEKEADDVANEVVDNTVIRTATETGVQQKRDIHREVVEEEPQARLDIQRECQEEEAQAKMEVQREVEEEEPQARMEIQREVEEEEAQAKMEIQREVEEEEAQAKMEIQREVEEEEAQAKMEIQREVEEEEPQAKMEVMREVEEEEPQAKSEMQQEKNEIAQSKSDLAILKSGNKGSGKESPEMEPGSFDDRLQKSKGKGFILPNDIMAEMETQFDADFGQVRIHTDSEAIALSKSIHAQAFTHGYDIYFNKGKYDPYSEGGKRLLAHELTHVVQQKGK